MRVLRVGQDQANPPALAALQIGLAHQPADALLVDRTVRVSAKAKQINGEWVVTKAIMSRGARVLMEGFVQVPGNSF
jgi:2-methylaconitate cis-trans-isomerase PrpF